MNVYQQIIVSNVLTHYDLNNKSRTRNLKTKKILVKTTYRTGLNCIANLNEAASDSRNVTVP